VGGACPLQNGKKKMERPGTIDVEVVKKSERKDAMFA